MNVLNLILDKCKTHKLRNLIYTIIKNKLVVILVLIQGSIIAQCDSSLNNKVLLATLNYYHYTLNKLTAKEIILADSSAYTSERAMMLLPTVEKELETVVGDQKQAGELVSGIFVTYKNKGSFSSINKCHGIKTISSAVISKTLNQKNGWTTFRKTYPDIKGFYISTLPYINAAKDMASIVVEYACGGLCGECYKFILLLNKETNTWEVKYKSALFYH